MTIVIRPMQIEDIPQVSQIEREAFPPPWPPTNFKRDLTVNTLTRYLVAYEAPIYDRQLQISQADSVDKSDASMLNSIIRAFSRSFRTAKADKNPEQYILGFAGLWFMADEAHLANIAVRETYRNKGIGEYLLVSVIELSIEQNASFITLEVRASNTTAQALYRKYGFIDTGVRPGYYTDNKEDAVIMTADGISTGAFKSEFLEMREAIERRLKELHI
jgi:ribosomal-protein-alanine N-acetyltransferase